MKNMLKYTLCAVVLAMAPGCNQPKVPKAPANAVYSDGFHPLSKDVDYSEIRNGFELKKKFKDGREVTLQYNECTIKVREAKPYRSITMKDMDLSEDGLEAITNNITQETCLCFEPSITKTSECTPERIRKRNKDFKQYMQTLKFNDHMQYWEKTKTDQGPAEGFDVYDVINIF